MASTSNRAPTTRRHELGQELVEDVCEHAGHLDGLFVTPAGVPRLVRHKSAAVARELGALDSLFVESATRAVWEETGAVGWAVGRRASGT